MSKPKLFIPGPVDISPATFEAMCAPMIGHRGADFEALYSSIQPGLQQIAGTQRRVFLSTSSAWGVMESAIRNLCERKLLCCMNGAFSDKWLDVARRSGLAADALQLEGRRHAWWVARMHIPTKYGYCRWWPGVVLKTHPVLVGLP